MTAPAPQPPAAASMPHTPASLPSVDVVFEAIKARLTAQDAQVAALDGKANFGLASATLLTAAVVSLQTAFVAAQKAPGARDLVLPGRAIATVLTALCIVAYVFVVVTSFKAYQLRVFKIVPVPQALVDDYLDKPAEFTKGRLAVAAAHVFAQNETVVAHKVRWTRLALGSLVVEACLLLLATIAQLILGS